MSIQITPAFETHIVDDAHAAALSSSGQSPADLPQAAGPGNEIAGVRVRHERGLKRGVGRVGQVVSDESGEQWRFDELEHEAYIRHCRTIVK